MAATVSEVKLLSTSEATETATQRSYSRAYHVVLLDKNDGERTALTGDDGVTSVPDIGEAHPDDSSAYVRNKTAKLQEDNEDTRLNWIVRVDYSTYTANMGDLDVRVGYEVVSEIALFDYNGLAILNSAKQPFVDPPVMEDRAYTVLYCARNEILTFEQMLARIAQYQDTVNSVTYLYQPPRCWKMYIEAARTYVGGVWCWRMSYLLRLCPSTWDFITSSMGTAKIQDSALYANQDGAGNMYGTPVNLDENGDMLEIGADPYVMTFQIKRQQDFNALGLPFV